MIIERVDRMGMELERWKHKSCVAHFGVDENWATLYEIKSTIENQGHATHLLKTAKEYYESRGKDFGGSVALSRPMERIYKKLNIKEYA